MRKVILGMNMSLDGYVAGPNNEKEWMFSHFTPPQFELITEILREADTIILGRINYLEQAAAWPKETSEMATLLNSHRKIVFSNTLKELEWSNSQLASADVGEEVRRLKEQPGKHIIATGGARFVQSLLRTGLVDEIRLTVHPVIVGGGLALFSDLIQPLNLKLIETRTFDSGSIALFYQAA